MCVLKRNKLLIYTGWMGFNSYLLSHIQICRAYGHHWTFQSL